MGTDRPLWTDEITTENATLCTLGFRATDGDEEARAKLRGMGELDLYGHRCAKRMILYTRLYFPKLARSSLHSEMLTSCCSRSQVGKRL
jgi:hypothetical protein